MQTLTEYWNGVRNNFYFASPEYLPGLWGVALLFLLYFAVLMVKNRKRPERTHGSFYPFLGSLRFWLAMILVFALGVLAISRPIIVKKGIAIVRGPAEVIILAGISFSEFAQDWGSSQPSRMEIARREILDLFSSNAIRNGDKVSFYVFANGSKGLMPLVDYEKYADMFINRISYWLSWHKTINEERDFYLGTSDIVVALQDIYQSLDRHDLLRAGDPDPEETISNPNWMPSQKTNRLVLVFSDGDFELNPATGYNDQEKEYIRQYGEMLNGVLGEYKKRGVRIYTVGIGTQKGIRLTNILKRYKKDDDYGEQDEIELSEKGMTRVSPNNLGRLAAGSGGNSRSDTYLIDEVDDSAAGFIKRVINSRRNVGFEPVSLEGNQELWSWLFLMAALLVFGLG